MLRHRRPRTDECYRNALTTHQLPRFARRRLDAGTPDDLARLVREMRAQRPSESTLAIVLGVINRMYRCTAQRLRWSSNNPVSLMLSYAATLTCDQEPVSTGDSRQQPTSTDRRPDLSRRRSPVRIRLGVLLLGAVDEPAAPVPIPPGHTASSARSRRYRDPPQKTVTPLFGWQRPPARIAGERRGQSRSYKRSMTYRLLAGSRR